MLLYKILQKWDRLLLLLQSLIGLGLSIGKATEKGHDDYGTAWGVAGESSPAAATWGVFVGLGSMAFAYSFVRFVALIIDTATPKKEGGGGGGGGGARSKVLLLQCHQTKVFWTSYNFQKINHLGSHFRQDPQGLLRNLIAQSSLLQADILQSAHHECQLIRGIDWAARKSWLAN